MSDASAERRGRKELTPEEERIVLHIAKRLEKRRKLMGLTMGQLAERVGIRFQQIQKYECGANRISAHRLFQIANALEVKVDYFYEGLETTAPEIPGAKAKTSEEKFRLAVVTAYEGGMDESSAMRILLQVGDRRD